MNETPVRPTLRRAAAAAVLPLAALAGCSYDSPYAREDTGRDFSSYLYSIDTPINASPEARPGRLVLPAKLAVAQIGEVAPPSRFLAALRGHETCSSASSRSAAPPASATTGGPSTARTAPAPPRSAPAWRWPACSVSPVTKS